jgi:hypothetical protein
MCEFGTYGRCGSLSPTSHRMMYDAGMWMFGRANVFGKRVGRQLMRAVPDTLKADPGALILVRHGESAWNANRTFTG